MKPNVVLVAGAKGPFQLSLRAVTVLPEPDVSAPQD
jgi:hypothetical protein